MIHPPSPLRRPLLGATLVGLLATGLLATPARGHGGRFAGPGGRGAPPDSTMPGPPAPKRGPPPTTPGSGIPSTTGALPDVYWGTWWALNRWAYLPERGEIQRRRRAALVTTGDARVKPSLEVLTAERRALLARQVIRPFLLERLDPASKESDTVTASALLALAKVHADEPTLDLLLKRVEDPGATPLERESAALAVGLLRRSDPAQRVDAISLDLGRQRLLDLLADGKVPIRARCFAAFALGLLADQGYGSPFHKDGRLVVKRLVEGLRGRHEGPDLPIALLTALSMHPREAIPAQVLDELQRAVTVGQVHKRSWTPIERSHALSALARLRSAGWMVLALRALGDRRMPDPVQRAARIVLGTGADALSAEERLGVAQALIRSERTAPDALSRGLGQIALARVLQADLRGGSGQLLAETPVARVLLEGARKGTIPVRGFHVLALALAARGVASIDPAVIRFVRSVREALLDGFDRPHGDDDLRGAYVIALGLTPVPAARERLLAVVDDRNAGPALRSRAAIALAQIGAGDPAVVAALQAMVADERPLAPRASAALALSLIRGVPESAPLVAQLRGADSQRTQVQAAAALGQLDDPAALPAVIEVARTKTHNAEVRAIALAILGLLGDPEERPSLFRLSLDANYVARTDALNEAFSLL